MIIFISSMKKIIGISIILIAFAISNFSCKKNNFEEIQLKKHSSDTSISTTTPPPQPVCDTTNVSYAANISSIFINNCNSCHGPGNSTGYSTDSYNSVVQDFEAIYSSIIQDGNYSAMPQSATKLDDCTIKKLTAWKNKGFPQ